ncbi:hypothetical protein HDU93_004298, partial [Gonapodya sp. JEL0774]
MTHNLFAGAPSAVSRILKYRYKDLPQVVKAGITAGTLVGIGDVLAQVASASSSSDAAVGDGSEGHFTVIQFAKSLGSTRWTVPERFDLERTGRLVLAGATFSGPYWYFGFRFIDRFVSAPAERISVQKFWSSVRKAACTFLVGSPHNPIFFALLAALEGKTVEDLKARAKLGNKVWMEGIVIWPFANLANYMFINPGISRIAFSNSIGIVWNIYVSKALAIDTARQAKRARTTENSNVTETVDTSMSVRLDSEGVPDSSYVE